MSPLARALGGALTVVKAGVADDTRVRREAVALVEAGRHVTVVGDRSGPNQDVQGVDLRFCREPSTGGSWSEAPDFAASCGGSCCRTIDGATIVCSSRPSLASARRSPPM